MQGVDRAGDLESSSTALCHVEKTSRNVGKAGFFAFGYSIFGLQLVWSTVFARGTDHLISLGFPEYLTPLAWIAAPVCGMVLQPAFGLLSDRCSTRWGQRKPFILCGSVAVAVSITGLAWVENTASSLRRLSGSTDIGGESERVLRCVLSFAWIWALNISIQSAQMGIRTSIVESCSRDQQASATAWSGVAVAIGNLCGYLLNALELNRIPMFGTVTSFQCLCVIVASLLVFLASLTCILAPRPSVALPAREKPRLRHLARGAAQTIFGELESHPKTIRQVFKIQFFSWMAWFPIMFYQTRYVAELYYFRMYSDHPWMGVSALVGVHEDGLRMASGAAVGFAVLSLATGALVPYFFRDSAHYPSEIQHGSRQRRQAILGNLQALSLPDLWILSHSFFAATMLCTLLVRSESAGMLLITMLGFPWALTAWIPHAILGMEIAERRLNSIGILTGLHNSFISAPQIVSVGVCTVLFKVSPLIGSNAPIVIVLRLGALPALIAAYLTLKLR